MEYIFDILIWRYFTFVIVISSTTFHLEAEMKTSNVTWKRGYVQPT